MVWRRKVARVLMSVLGGVLLLPMPVEASIASEARKYFPDTIDMTLDEVIQLFFNTAISFAAVVAVAYLMINGFKYMASGGDTSKTEEAQKGLGNAIIGLVICICAAIIVNYVLELLGTEPQSVG